MANPMILGAEKLKPELFRDIQSWLGIEPMEGYGTTELSPVVAVNVPSEVTLRSAPEPSAGRVGRYDFLPGNNHVRAGASGFTGGHPHCPGGEATECRATARIGLYRQLWRIR